MSVEQMKLSPAYNILNCEQRRRLPRCHRQSSHSALERGHALLQHGLRRIHDAGVDVAELLEREQVGGVLSGIELVGGRLIDRHRDRRGGGRVRAVARVQHDGFGMLAFSWHGSPQADPKVAVSDNNPTAYSTPRRMVNSSPFVTTGFDGPFRPLP